MRPAFLLCEGLKETLREGGLLIQECMRKARRKPDSDLHTQNGGGNYFCVLQSSSLQWASPAHVRQEMLVYKQTSGKERRRDDTIKNLPNVVDVHAGE